MWQLITYLVFIISAAMTAGGIILSSRLRNKFHNDTYSALLYFQVFIYTFGFYGIWGQVVIKAYLSEYISPELLTRITDISMLLGLPFLVFAWLMLIKLACGLSGKVCNNWFVLSFLILNFTLIVAIGYLIAGEGIIKPALLLKIYFISLNFINSAVSAWLLYHSEKRKNALNSKDCRITGSALMLIMLLQCVPVYFYEGQTVIGLVFIVTFFTGNAFLPVYLTYGTQLSLKVAEEPVRDISFEDFCIKYDVSPREKDIVREICNGLSNKEIADKLFITIQTVKDHTHRIYIKTNVRSRAQLMNMVKNLEGKA
ncbi:MAG TPA: LuxR C-terminal-related transcriptional regulator [Bacteroidales bacterium]|nr:LuxR C-terminal-related transcriptional regulator [Bacteroidales bacterium]